jgi:PAS domain S-box-containing protein
MIPEFLRTPVLASYSAELVAALFCAAVILSFRRAFPRVDLLSWGGAWAASTGFTSLGLLAHTLPWEPTEVTALRLVGRAGALLQAVLLLRGAYRLTAVEPPAWLRRALYLIPLLATGSALVSAGAGRGPLELSSRAFASLAVGLAALAAAARVRGARPAGSNLGMRLMTVALVLYGVMKIFSPMTLGRMGLLQGHLAAEALFLGFSLAPSTFALGCVVSLLEDRERVLAGERDRLRVSEEKFSKLFRSSPDAILLTRPLGGGLIVDVNESFEAFSGYTRAEAIGKTTVELGLFDSGKREALVAEALAAGRVREWEIEVSGRAGERRLVSLSAEWIDIEGEPHSLSVVRDVTERRQAEVRLRRSEELFRAVVEDQTEMIVRWKPDGTRTFVNPAYCRVFGGSPADHVGSSFMPLVAEEYREVVRQKVLALTPSMPVVTHVHESLSDSGRRWQEWTDRGIFDADGNLVELQSTGRDVTERFKGVRRLRESEERLRLALDAARMGVWEWDPVTGAAVWSPRVEQIIGFLPSSALEAPGEYLAHVHAPDREALERLMAETLAGASEGFWHEHRVRGDDGVLRWVEARARSFTAAEGHAVLKGTVVAIAERKETEEALRLSEERLRRMAEASFEGLAFSENGLLIDANEQLARMLGYSLDELIGKPVVELVAPEHRARVGDAMQRHEPGAYEHLALRKDGSTLLVEARARRFEFEEHSLRVTAVRDISEQAELNERLGRSERMAEVGRLVAGVAHEVRTPLFSISATLDAYEGLLHEPRERGEFLELLRSQVHRLSGLMHDLLDYGRPAALRLQPGEIRSVIERAVRSCASQAQTAGVCLDAATAPAADFQLLRDPDRLEQVFQNLLSNAIHHAPRGSVVRISVMRHAAEGLVCTVDDEGPGLRPEDLARVFEPFFSRRKGGIGLGLAIVRRIVEEHGGSVRATNRAGGGASFSVSLMGTRSRAA